MRPALAHNINEQPLIAGRDRVRSHEIPQSEHLDALLQRRSVVSFVGKCCGNDTEHLVDVESRGTGKLKMSDGGWVETAC